MNYSSPADPSCAESLRLEGVLTSVNYDDVLDIALGLNHCHFDHLIVVTSHEDKKTQAVCRKHSVTCAITDLFKKNGRNFNKGAAINAGFDHFQYYGWRMHLDVDIILPDNFRRMLFNHTHLDTKHIYGAERRDIVGMGAFEKLMKSRMKFPQHAFHSGVSTEHNGGLGDLSPSASSADYVDTLRGYCPIGFFQLWHWSQQKEYPYSLGNAAHDDVMFSSKWPLEHRTKLPSVKCYHLVGRPPYYGENWDGNRRQPRLD